MEVSRIISEIDAEISKLQQARELLDGVDRVKRPGPGRPKGSKNSTTPKTTSSGRKLTTEGRKRIADAMKRRWADRKGSSSKG